MRGDIFDLIREASRIGFWTVLGTHGGLLDERGVERLAASGLKGAGVSLDSIDQAKHDRFRGIAKAWDKAVLAMDALRAAGVAFLVETTVTRLNRTELPAMADFALEKGATALNVFFLVPTGRAANLTGLTVEECEDTLTVLASLQERHAGKLLVNAKCAPHYRRVLWERNRDSPYVRTFRGGGCPAGTYYCRITPTGDVTPCAYMPLPVGNVRRTSFEELWEKSPILRDFRADGLGGRCGRCEFSQVCGGCRCRAYAVTGNYLAEDPSCGFQPGKYGKVSIPFPSERSYGSPAAGTLEWTPGAVQSLEKVPLFARGMVSQAVEKAARGRGQAVVTEELLQELRRAMAGRFHAAGPARDCREPNGSA